MRGDSIVGEECGGREISLFFRSGVKKHHPLSFPPYNYCQFYMFLPPQNKVCQKHPPPGTPPLQYCSLRLLAEQSWRNGRKTSVVSLVFAFRSPPGTLLGAANRKQRTSGCRSIGLGWKLLAVAVSSSLRQADRLRCLAHGE